METNFSVKKFTKGVGESVSSQHLLKVYANSTNIGINHSVYDFDKFLRGFYRTEYYVYENYSHLPCACIMLVMGTDMHYGDIVQVLANFTQKQYEGNFEIKRIIRWAIKDFNKMYNVKYYQRSKHIGNASSNKQLLITKEI